MNDNSKILQHQLNQIENNLSNSMKVIGDIMVDEFKSNMSREGIRMRTGQLEKSIAISEIDSNSVTVTSNVDYASYVNDGTSRMKARPFMKETSNLDNKIEKIIDNTIKTVIK